MVNTSVGNSVCDPLRRASRAGLFFSLLLFLTHLATSEIRRDSERRRMKRRTVALITHHLQRRRREGKGERCERKKKETINQGLSGEKKGERKGGETKFILKLPPSILFSYLNSRTCPPVSKWNWMFGFFIEIWSNYSKNG